MDNSEINSILELKRKNLISRLNDIGHIYNTQCLLKGDIIKLINGVLK